jgi:oxygen-independent coproporphyrinogen-3 oxidase
VRKGYFLSEEDVAFRHYILDISCRGKTHFSKEHLPLLEHFSFPALEAMHADGLVNYTNDSLKVTALGLHFIRNICSAFDLHLLRRAGKSSDTLFSKAI